MVGSSDGDSDGNVEGGKVGRGVEGLADCRSAEGDTDKVGNMEGTSDSCSGSKSPPLVSVKFTE